MSSILVGFVILVGYGLPRPYGRLQQHTTGSFLRHFSVINTNPSWQNLELFKKLPLVSLVILLWFLQNPNIFSQILVDMGGKVVFLARFFITKFTNEIQKRAL